MSSAWIRAKPNPKVKTDGKSARNIRYGLTAPYLGRLKKTRCPAPTFPAYGGYVKAIKEFVKTVSSKD